MNLDPTLLEALVAAVLTLLGVGAGVGVRRRGAAGGDDGGVESAAAVELARVQAELAGKVGELSARVERVEGELGRIDARAGKQERAHARLGADFDAVADALDVLVTHIGGELPEQARRSVRDKLERRQRHEVTNRRPAAR